MIRVQSLLIGQRQTPLRFTTAATSLLVLFAAILIGSIQPVSAQLTVQIVNDSGLSDSNVFIMVPGAKAGAVINPPNLFVDKGAGTNTAVALSTLASNGSAPPFQITSLISGNTNTVYSFQADYITSGAIYFIYNNPFTFSSGITPSPAPDSGNGGSGYRYDYAELSFLGGDVNNDVDLTYVDKFGIPMQLEWFRGTNTAATNLVAGSYVYASTKTLANLFANGGFNSAVFGLTNAGATNGNITPGWQYAGPDSYTNFARILAPQKISTGSPYPSVTNILDFLTVNPFTLNGYSVQGDYYYLGYQVNVAKTNDPLTGIGEWLFTLAYNSNSVPSQYDLADIGAVGSQLQYTNTITFLVPDVTVGTNYVTVTNSGVITTNTFFVTNNIDPNIYVYGAPSSTNNYLVNGAPPADTNASPVELWMIGDVLSAINFGFAGGIYGNNSDQWFSPNVAWPDPYGRAQPSPRNNLTSGYYNAYAALMYYNADAYTFAYSERITPDVGMAVKNGDVVRITILPDDRLDSPVVSIPTNLIKASSITLNWNPVPGATNYQVNILRPLGFGPTLVSSNSCTLSGLAAGTPYVMSVQALGTANGNPIITPARPVFATTTGTNTTVTNGNLTAVQVAFSVSDPFYQVGYVLINGIELFRTNSVNSSPWQNTNGVPARWLASAGTNQVPVTVYDNNGKVLFNDWFTFTLTSNTISEYAVSDFTFFGQQTGTLPALNTSNPFTISTTSYNVIFALNYVPAETRKYAPVLSTSPSNSPVIITDVTALAGGGIQFGFDVPAGTNYVVESSANLTSWKTNATGVGQIGGESYTNAAGANAVQFYRIKL